MKVNIKKAEELREMLKTTEQLEEEQTVKFVEDIVADLENATQVAKTFVEAVVGPKASMELLDKVSDTLSLHGYSVDVREEFVDQEDPEDETKTIKILKARVMKVSI